MSKFCSLCENGFVQDTNLNEYPRTKVQIVKLYLLNTEASFDISEVFCFIFVEAFLSVCP